MPKRIKETEEEYYIRAAAEAKKAKNALAKKQRQDRNELINKVGKLFVEKCGLILFEEYKRIWKSDEFKNIYSANADSKNKPQAESLAAYEGSADVPSDVEQTKRNIFFQDPDFYSENGPLQPTIKPFVSVLLPYYGTYSHRHCL